MFIVRGKLMRCFTSLVLVSTLSVIYMYYWFSTNSFMSAVSPARTTDQVHVFGHESFQDLELNERIVGKRHTRIVQQSRNITTFKRYLLPLVYCEQLTNAFSHFNELLSLATQWNFTGVEPFVHDSRLSGFQTLHPDSIDIRQLFDMELFHKNYLKCVGGRNRSLLETMNSFLQNSFRKIVVVYFSAHRFGLPRKILKSMDSSLVRLFSSHNDTPIIVTCTKLAAQSFTPAVQDILEKEQFKFSNKRIPIEQFIVQEVFCVRKTILSLTRLMDHIANYLHTTRLKASVIFVSWQGRLTRTFTGIRTMRSCVLPPFQVPFSSEVKQYAEMFRQSNRLSPNNYISLHIRFEKLIKFAYEERALNESSFYNCCMKRLEQALEVLARENSIPLNHTLFLHDYSDHGSKACRYNNRWTSSEVCQDKANRMMSMLSINVTEFNPSLFQLGVVNSGFVSLVEQASLLKGRVLVTVGSGTFQSALIKRFVDHHSNRTFNATSLHYQLCINEKLHQLKVDSHEC